MKYAFHPEAEEEFLDAIDYYARCESGLGYDFGSKFTLQLRVSSAFQALGLFLETTYVDARSGVFHLASSIPKMEMFHSSRYAPASRSCLLERPNLASGEITVCR